MSGLSFLGQIDVESPHGALALRGTARGLLVDAARAATLADLVAVDMRGTHRVRRVERLDRALRHARIRLEMCVAGVPIARIGHGVQPTLPGRLARLKPLALSWRGLAIALAGRLRARRRHA